MFHGLPGFASSSPQRGGFNTKPRDHDTLKSHKHLIYYNLLCGGDPHESNANEILIWLRVQSPMCWNPTWRRMITQNPIFIFHGMAFDRVSSALTKFVVTAFDHCRIVALRERQALKALHKCLSYFRFVVDLIDTQYNSQNGTTWWEECWPICSIFWFFSIN